MSEPQRRLAAIFAADVVGYGGRVAIDGAGKIPRARVFCDVCATPTAATHAGRRFKTNCDGLLQVCPSAARLKPFDTRGRFEIGAAGPV